MRTHLRFGSVLAVVTPLLMACGGEAPKPAVAVPAPPPAASASVATASNAATDAKAVPETLGADATRATAGATFTAPNGWTLTLDPSRALLLGPEADLKMAIVGSTATNADDAVAAAWPALRPDFKRALKLAQDVPGREGWEAVRNYDYEVSPNEKALAFAYAFKKGSSWTVVLCESGTASFEKRESAVGLIFGSLRPAGYSRESFAGKTPHALDASRLKELTDFIEKGRDALDLPGVAIGLVQGDKVIFEGGFGVRELGKPTKVDADTKFIIASNTKALTTLLMATEVDEGKFTWDTPVTQVYPSFKLGDADTTSKVLMKHLICACTGMPRQDMEWLFEFKNATPKSEIEALSTFQPTTKFGETFQYSNSMAAAAGFIAGHVADPKKELGAAYDEAMQSRVFTPLGMNETTLDFGRALREDHASAHGRDFDGKMVVADMNINRAVLPLRPAGAAWSSARDMLKYVQMELSKGKLPNGKTLVSEANLMARRTPQVKVGEHTTYGMGLEVDTKYGVPVVHHGGDMIGMHSDMFWLPDQNVGGVILTNADGGWSLRGPFIRKVQEVLFDGHPEADEDVATSARVAKAAIAKERERLVVPPAADAVAALAGHYKCDALGDLTVKKHGPGVVFDFGEWHSPVASRKNDDGSTSFITVEPGMEGTDLVVGTRDGKRALVIRDMQHEYAFIETK